MWMRAGNSCSLHRCSSTTALPESCEAMLKIIGTALLTAFVTSMFWIWFYNFVPSAGADGRPQRTGGHCQARQRSAGRGCRTGAGRAVGLALSGRRHQARASSPTRSMRLAPGPAPRCHRHHGRRGNAGHRRRRRHGRETVLQRRGGGITIYERSPDGKWKYYYAHLSGLRAGPARRPAGEARAGDRPRRPYRRCQSRRPHLHFAINTHGAGRALVAGHGDQSYPCLPERQASG